jgi:tetratricopeptide (TPR) repeat protein
MGLAVALEALGKGVEARREFAETLRLDASNVEAHYDLGLIMARMGEDRAALGEFDAAIRLKPDFGPAHVARAYTLYSLGMFAEAGQAVQAARVAKTDVNPAFAAELAHRLGR